jgi:hypothetical protein
MRIRRDFFFFFFFFNSTIYIDGARNVPLLVFNTRVIYLVRDFIKYLYTIAPVNIEKEKQKTKTVPSLTRLHQQKPSTC